MTFQIRTAFSEPEGNDPRMWNWEPGLLALKKQPTLPPEARELERSLNHHPLHPPTDRLWQKIKALHAAIDGRAPIKSGVGSWELKFCFKYSFTATIESDMYITEHDMILVCYRKHSWKWSFYDLFLGKFTSRWRLTSLRRIAKARKTQSHLICFCLTVHWQ